MNGWSMDKPGKTIGNIVSDTLTFMDDMGLSMAASDNPHFQASVTRSTVPLTLPHIIILVLLNGFYSGTLLQQRPLYKPEVCLLIFLKVALS